MPGPETIPDIAAEPLPLSVSVSPVGKPEAVIAGVGVPDAATAKPNSNPDMAFADDVERIAGRLPYTYWSAAEDGDVPPGVVTVTLTVPDPAGAVAVISVAETTDTPVAAAVPKLTVAPATNPVPVTVTMVPPAVTPPIGLSPVTAGTAS